MEQLTQTGIGVVDHMAWGTHFCHFYETKKDLLDTLVPYLKAGLDNNEFCIWVVAQPLTSAEAIKAIRAAVPAIDLHLSNRDLMIVSYRDWYLRDGSFNLQRVLNSWEQKVAEALARGYAGVRVTGDVVWEDQNGWRNFAEYERAVADAISDLRMTALCTYALGNCGASQVLDVVSSHQFALATRNGELEVVENSETKKTNTEFQRLNRELEGRVIERTGELEQRIVERKQAEIHSAAFAALARKLSGASVPLDAAKIIVDTADQLFGWDSCTINLYDTDRDVLQPVLGIDTFDGQRANVGSLAKERKPTPRIRRLIEQSSGLTLREEPCAFDEDSVPFGDKTRPSASIMDVLIRHASEIIGTLSLQSYTPRSYDQNALNNLQALAEHCGEALNRIRAEQALRESEERYRDLIESSQDVFCTHDLDGRLLSANRAAEKLLNYEAKEFAGKNLRELVAPAVRDQFDDYLARIRRDGIVSGSTLVLTSKGERRVWEFYNTLRTEGVAAPIIRCMARDITERKRAEESLKVFRNLIDQSNDAIEVIDAHTFRFLDCNQSAYQSLGYTREEFLRLSVFDIDPLVDRGTIAKQDDEIAKSGFATVESIHLRKDGTAFPVEINVKVVRLERDYRLAVVRDITGRKQTEAALRLAEQKYRHIFENAGEGIFQSTAEGRFITANPALARMLGYDSTEELIDNRVDIQRQHYVDPLRRQEFKRLVEANGFIRDFEYEAYKKDGSKLWITTNVRAVREEDGTLLYYEGTAQDITERQKVETRLRENEKQLREAQRIARIGSWHWDIPNNLSVWSEELLNIFGIKSEEFCPTYEGVKAWVHPEDRADVEKTVQTALIELQPHQYDYRIVRPDGTVRMIHAEGEVVCDEGGRPIALAGTAQDITERKRAEEAVRDAEQKYRELFENAKDAIYVHDLKGCYTSVNPAAETLSGYSRDEIVGRHYTEFIAPEYLKPVRENLCRKLSESGETSYEVEVIAKDGRRVPLEINSRLIRRNGEAVAVQGTARDITERKRAQEAMRSYSHRLIEAQEAERQNIARELHDEIGQVLTAVRINLQSAQRSSGTEAYLLRIEDSIVVVDEALNRVRELSLQLRPSLLDDLGLTAALRWYADRYARRTGFTVQILSDCETGRLRRELETACFRIAQEALTNVARYTEATHILVELKRANDTLSLVIKDDGPGFDVAALLRNAPAGAVLGLRGMEERALAVEGRFEINSAPGQGTEVRATFPLTRKG